MSDLTQPVKSPCIEVCSLNNEDVCIGCYRTANEIIEWFSAPNERKREILAGDLLYDDTYYVNTT